MGFSIGGLVSDVIQLYSFLMLIWCLCSWFPNVRWYDQPFKTLDAIIQPVVAPFRRVIPPINNIDLSPMIAMAVLQFVGVFVRNSLP